jgi:hypothetical protein
MRKPGGGPAADHLRLQADFPNKPSDARSNVVDKVTRLDPCMPDLEQNFPESRQE